MTFTSRNNKTNKFLEELSDALNLSSGIGISSANIHIEFGKLISVELTLVIPDDHPINLNVSQEENNPYD